MNTIVFEASKLPLIPLEAMQEYYLNKQKMIEFVDSQMDNVANIDFLIGHNSKMVMYDNHRHHAGFMSNIFKFNQSELLARTIPWVYASYNAHGFSYDYFSLELEKWKEAVLKFIQARNRDEILAVYDWMLSNHQTMIKLANQENMFTALANKKVSDTVKRWTAMLVQGEILQAHEYAQELIKQMDFKNVYMEVFQPCLHYIGQLWEKGEINVAQEHMASALIMRIMSSMQHFMLNPQIKKVKVIVTAAPNELHEIGARMVADFLEADGWTVYYLGANVPLEELAAVVRNFQPDLLAISLTMPFNIDRAAEIISTVRDSGEMPQLKIMIGGQILNSMPGLHKCLKADGFAGNAYDAVSLANKLLELG